MYNQSTSKRVTIQVESKLGEHPGRHINEPCKVCGRKAVFMVDKGDWYEIICYYCEGLL